MRSRNANSYGLAVLNSPGTIDSDYRGEIKVILINHGKNDYIVTKGMKCAQLVISPVTRITLVECLTLDETIRGNGGFGSTDK